MSDVASTSCPRRHTLEHQNAQKSEEFATAPKQSGTNYLQPCYSIHCAEVLEAKVGPIINLCGIATVFRA